jgi:aminoglycoside phosphotransferase (APT) family kinase protein
VSALVAVRFPDLAGAPVSRLGAGCDHELFLVGDEWIFRFPKRAERVAWLRREIQVVAIAAEALGDRVPRFERIAEPSAPFPYPFVGYRRLAGVGADRVTDGDRPELAADIGRVLSALHRVDPARIPAVPGGGQHASWDELRAELAAVGHLARPLLAAGLLAEAEPYLAGQFAAPARAGPRRFIHNDVCPDHVIVDPATDRLVGLRRQPGMVVPHAHPDLARRHGRPRPWRHPQAPVLGGPRLRPLTRRPALTSGADWPGRRHGGARRAGHGRWSRS